ncbi:MAG: hypothetical protein FLDDKLPJ_01608 [Phycisphaerae bacterium]|nr:hypothetical protein [Phycisphaerae bacterium]
MRTAFVDTSFLIACVLVKDVWHARAIAWQRRTVGRLVTTEYVLMEFVDALSQPPVRRSALAAVGLLRRQPAVGVLTASTALMDEGLALYAQSADKAWSLTDCISFSVMRREGLSDALTSDRHFEQAGFRALLRIDAPA